MDRHFNFKMVNTKEDAEFLEQKRFVIEQLLASGVPVASHIDSAGVINNGIIDQPYLYQDPESGEFVHIDSPVNVISKAADDRGAIFFEDPARSGYVSGVVAPALKDSSYQEGSFHRGVMKFTGNPNQFSGFRSMAVNAVESCRTAIGVVVAKIDAKGKVVGIMDVATYQLNVPEAIEASIQEGLTGSGIAQTVAEGAGKQIEQAVVEVIEEIVNES